MQVSHTASRSPMPCATTHRHCLPGSALAGNLSQEPEAGIEPKMGILTTRLNAHSLVAGYCEHECILLDVDGIVTCCDAISSKSRPVLNFQLIMRAV